MPFDEVYTNKRLIRPGLLVILIFFCFSFRNNDSSLLRRLGVYILSSKIPV